MNDCGTTFYSLALNKNGTLCLADHDGALCWPPALSGTKVELPCPQTFNEQAYEIGGKSMWLIKAKRSKRFKQLSITYVVLCLKVRDDIIAWYVNGNR